MSEAGYRWFIEPPDLGLLREVLQEEWGDGTPHQRCSVPVTFMPVGTELMGWDCHGSGGPQQSFNVPVVITLSGAPH